MVHCRIEESEMALKTFVSEKEIEEVKKKRQEEWEKVRRPDQPLQRPEEEVDHRTLYERLKQQKDKKQEEWEEQFKFKNMIYKGLDDDESRFLNFVADQEAQQKAAKLSEEMQELSEYREAVCRLHEEASSVTTASSDKPHSIEVSPQAAKLTSPKSGPGSLPGKTHKSQLSLLAGSIKTKRKRSASQDEEKTKTASVSDPEKKPRLAHDAKAVDRTAQLENECDTSGSSDAQLQTSVPATTLPGLAAYSSSDNDSDVEPPTNS